MADAILIKLFNLPSIDWAGGHDMQSMNKRRKQYIQALRAADRQNYHPLFAFASIDADH